MQTCFAINVSIRNDGVPVSNQYGRKRRLRNSWRMPKGLYTRSSPSQQ